MSIRPPMQFYIPADDNVFARLPTDLYSYWEWQSNAAGLIPYWGRYHWVLQTFLYLKSANVDCLLINQLPTTGILLTHLGCLDYGFRPGRELYVVGFLVDVEVPQPYVQLHITHNPVQKLPLGLNYVYVPPWPQIGIKERLASRGDRFECVGYYGYPWNLDPEMKTEAFRRGLCDMGLTLVCPEPRDWNDFSGVDAVLAIRKIGRTDPHLNKPSLKLYNAWLAGVPAILGYESAYRVEGRHGVNYMEAATIEEVLVCLRKLKEDLVFRRQLVENGRSASTKYSSQATIGKWKSLKDHELYPRYRRWRSRPTELIANRLFGSVRERLLWRRPNWFD